MKTHFYNRTPYKYFDEKPPTCFLELDNYYDSIFSNINDFFKDPYSILAENICRRMADIDLYASLISASLNDVSLFRGATFIGSYMVGYFSAGKSFLDSGSITISELFQLPLSKKEMDFSKKKFWSVLKTNRIDIFDKYEIFKPFVNKVVEWRDSAIHRTTPLVIVSGPGHPEEVPREKMEIKMALKPDINIISFVKDKDNRKLMNPLLLHNVWRKTFISLCEFLCDDLRNVSESLLSKEKST